MGTEGDANASRRLPLLRVKQVQRCPDLPWCREKSREVLKKRASEIVNCLFRVDNLHPTFAEQGNSEGICRRRYLGSRHRLPPPRKCIGGEGKARRAMHPPAGV